MSTPDNESPVATATDPSTAVTVATATTRRVPPPCWTDEETAALVDAYKDKWFALRRGNLRAADWDDVAASLPTLGGPAKTPIQCRHKIEKLRKRYRGEKQRCLNKPPGKFSSSWDLFPVLDAMEFASVASPAAAEPYDHDVDHEEDEGNGVGGFRVRSKRSLMSTPREGFGVRSRVKSQMKMYGGGFDSDHDSGGGFGLKRRYNGHPKVNPGFDADSDDEILLAPKATRLRGSHHGGAGFPLKSYGDRSFASHGFKAKNFSSNYDDEFDDEREGLKPRIHNSRSSSRVNGYSYPRVSNGYGSSSRLKQEPMNEPDPIDEVVSSVKMLTEMFVRVEKSKMEMMREMEKTRMEMELKHCQMMLESQQQIIGAFMEALSEKKSTNTRRTVS
ncbi:protein FIP2-like [Raphanus sativus]|uniref:Protein FIP2-like n=1 Tax=Raphanus sativus TaxID=3726 RepID=A0A9W3C845_RAPSA|nr:protein FIP2-like [Raphanus sativus]